MAELLEPFVRPVPVGTLRTHVAICRVWMGVGLVHRYVDIAGFAALADDPRTVGIQALVAAGLGLCLLVGFLTPLALCALVLYDFVTARFGFTLGLQVQTILAWGLLLLGAGRAWSVDAALARVPGLGRGIRALYVCGVPEEDGEVARVRLVLAWLFWGLTTSSLMPHAYDAYWLRGDVLQLLGDSPFWIRQFETMRSFRGATPLFYDLLLSVGLYVQTFWELCFFPLLYFRWTRWFAVGQGAAFFLVCLVLIPLGYLPYVELGLWYLLFGPIRTSAASPGAGRGFGSPVPAVGRAVVRGFGLTALGVVLLHTAVNLPPSLRRAWAPRLRPPPWNTFYRAFGQRRINVFNRADLETGAVYAMLYETDADGRPLRVVPYRDHHGARLHYVRNDFLMNRWMFNTVRAGRDRKFEQDDPTQPASFYAQYLRRLLLLDACITDTGQTRHYAADIFVKELVDTPRFTIWSAPRAMSTLTQTIDQGEVDSVRRHWPWSFDLLPGHAGTARRLEDSLAYLRARGEAPPPAALGSG